jgi:hypothetical protein
MPTGRKNHGAASENGRNSNNLFGEAVINRENMPTGRKNHGAAASENGRNNDDLFGEAVVNRENMPTGRRNHGAASGDGGNSDNLFGEAVANRENMPIRRRNPGAAASGDGGNSDGLFGEAVINRENMPTGRRNPGVASGDGENSDNLFGEAVANRENVNRENMPTRRKNHGTAASENGRNSDDLFGEAVANRENMPTRRKNFGTAASGDGENSDNLFGEAVANRENMPTGRKNPGAIAENGENDGEVAGKKKGSRARKMVPKVEQQSNSAGEDLPLQQRVNDLLARLFGVDFTKTWEEIEKILIATAEYTRLWCEEGEVLKNSNRDLLSESERFYRIACEKELQVQELGEQLAAAKNLSGDHFVNFAINRGLILPNEADAWKEKYIADPNGASNDLLRQTCFLNTTSKTEHLRQSPNPRGKEQILALVDGRMRDSGESYAEAWSAIKRTHPTLF